VSKLNHDRPGLSLVELVAVIALAGLVGGTIVTTITRQQRFYRNAAETLYARESVRDAIAVLSTDIRLASVADTIRPLADSAIEFFATIGASVVCQTVGNEVGLAPAHAAGNSLSGFLIEPDTGDLVLFRTDSAGAGEHWERYRISSFTSRSLASSCTAASRFSRNSDFAAGVTGFVVTLTTALRGDVKPGAPVRFIRRARYGLYHASDGGWYLGYRRCNAVGPSACGVVQPVSGPYRGYSPDPAATGLLFEYFDVLGRRLDAAASPLALARVDVTARTESLSSGSRSEKISDSAKTSVAIRNRAQ
jgi:type II secretory pathway pseudopilin PulG